VTGQSPQRAVVPMEEEEVEEEEEAGGGGGGGGGYPLKCQASLTQQHHHIPDDMNPHWDCSLYSD